MAKIKIKVENVVASTALGQKFDLAVITGGMDKVEYEPEQFPGLVYHLDEPKAAALIFGSGKIVCTGAKSIPDAERAAENIHKKLKELNLLEGRAGSSAKGPRASPTPRG